MTKKDALQILAILKAAYPSSYNGMTKEEATGTVAVWCMQFAGTPVDIVLMAVHKLISTNKFPPSVSEVKNKIQSIHWEAYDILTDNSRSAFLSEEDRVQYKRIYEATKEYKHPVTLEPSIRQMLSGRNYLQLGSGGE